MPDGSTDASKHGLPKESLKNPIESGRAPGNPRSTLPHVVYSASVRHPMVMVYVPPIFTNGLASRSCSFQGWNHLPNLRHGLQLSLGLFLLPLLTGFSRCLHMPQIIEPAKLLGPFL
jgi:hypothetical protein